MSEETFTLAQVRGGTGWPEGVRFKTVEPPWPEGDTHTDATTTGSADLPLPGDLLDGAIIVASVWGNDAAQDDGTPPFGTFMLLRAEPPFYAVVEAVWNGGGWIVTERTAHPHIVFAASAYEAAGGDV